MDENYYEPPSAPLVELHGAPEANEKSFRFWIIPGTACFFAGILCAIGFLTFGTIAIRSMLHDPSGLDIDLDLVRLIIASGLGVACVLFAYAGKTWLQRRSGRAFIMMAGGVLAFASVIAIVKFTDKVVEKKIAEQGRPSLEIDRRFGHD